MSWLTTSSAIFAVLITISSSSTAFANDAKAPVCANDADPKNDDLLKTFNATKDPLKILYLDYVKTIGKPTPDCPATKGGPTTDLKKVADKVEGNNNPQMLGFDAEGTAPAQRPHLIKRECIAASLKRDSGNTMWNCTGKNQSSAIKIPLKSGMQCYTDDMIDYVQFAVNSAITCFSENEPVDARVIYQKLNNETGFNYSLAYKGGAGIGQLTTPAKNELADPVHGRAQYLLEDLTKSNKASCQPFRQVAEQDLKKNPTILLNNPCEFVSAGEGLTRNLMYAVGYYVYTRDHQIEPLLFSRSPSIAANKEVVSALTAVAYGAEGLDKARLIVDKYRVNKQTNPAQFLKQAQSSSVYLKAIKNKMGEMYCIKSNIEPSSKECTALKAKLTPQQLGADACVQ